MKLRQKDFQNAYGNAPEDFHLRLLETLNGLEEKKMKKRYTPAKLLIAAVILALVLAGAAVAVGQLDVFHLMDTAEPIVPLEGADQLVGLNLGSTENEYAVLTVEQAVFDGQGIMVQCRLAPKDIDNYAMLNEFMQGISEEYYNIERRPVEFGEGATSTEEDDGTTITISNMDNEQHLLLNGEDIDFPATREEANEKGLPVYRVDGTIYFAEFEEAVATSRKDGRGMIDWWINMDTNNELLSENSSDAQEQEDGSVLFWAEGSAFETLDLDEIEVKLQASVYVDGQKYPLDELCFTLPKNEEERVYTLKPVEDGKLERFEFLSGNIVCTKVRGYLKVDYWYEEAENEEMGVTMNIYDANGEPIVTGSGGNYWDDEENIYHERVEIQSFDQAPERVWLEAKVIGEDKILGKFECALVEEK